VHDDDTVFIADHRNHRIMVWKKGDNAVHIVASGRGQGNGLLQLNAPTDILLEKETRSLIICDLGNKRVVRWALNNGTLGEVLVDNISCWGLAMDKQGCLYVSDCGNDEVRRFTRGDTKGIVVASWVSSRSLCSHQYYIFVDEEQSVYVSDHWNDRVMKWLKGAKEGIVVAGGKGQGKELTQLNCPRGLWVDEMGKVYADEGENNHRVTRWPKGESRGSVVVGGNGCGNATNQFKRPSEVSFDRRGNMYVVDFDNHRVQRFKLENN
jgi:hypothetical protein